MYERISLPDYLRANGVKLKGVTVFGLIKGAIIPPPPIDTIFIKADRTATAIIDLVAIKHNNQMYWTHGEMLVNIHPSFVDKAADTPTRRLAVTVTGGRLELSHHNITAMYKWGMDNGTFVCMNSFVDRLDPKAYPEVIAMIAEGAKNNWEFPFTKAVDGKIYQPASNGFKFKYNDTWEFLHTLAVDKKAVENLSNGVVDGGITGNATRGGQEASPTYTQNQPQQTNQFANNTQPVPQQPVHQQPPQQPTPPSHVVPNASGQMYNPMIHGQAVQGGAVLPVKRVVSGFNSRAKSNIVLTDTSKTKPDYHREEALPYSKLMEEYQEVYYKGLDRIGELVAEKATWQSQPFMETIRQQMVEGIIKNWSSRYLDKSFENQFKNLLISMVEEDEYEYSGISFSDGFSMPTKNIIESALKDYGSNLVKLLITPRKAEKDEYKYLNEFIERTKDIILLRFLEPYLDLRANSLKPLTRLLAGVEDINMYFSNNIYMMGLELPNIKVDALDKLRFLFGIEMTPEMNKVRNAIKVHGILLDENEHWIDGSTVHPRQTVEKNVKKGYALTAFQYRNYQKNGCLIPENKLSGLNALFDGQLTKEDFSLGEDMTVSKVGHTYYLSSPKDADNSLVQDALDCGVALELESPETGQIYIIDTALAKKEIYVYQRLYGMIDNPQIENLTQEMIDESVEEFEEKKDEELGLPKGTFKLEERQRSAANLIKYSVAILTGGAGSGKTTTAEFLLYCIKKYMEVDESEIFFAAPTGKASQRLSEVVKEKAFTAHNLFGLPVGAHYTLDDDHKGRPIEIKGLIFDESSIADINLIYAMLVKTPEDAFIYFLGDDDQLPPIGFGKPLANLLTFLPVVHLNVSKRAAAGSKITVNANRTVDPQDTAPLERDNTMEIIDEKDPEILVQKVLSLIKFHISDNNSYVNTFGLPLLEGVGRGLTAEQVQVVTPYSSSGIYASKVLNKTLQEIFNPLRQGMEQLVVTTGYNTEVEHTYFRVGDRVIHSKGNKAKQRRYARLQGSEFKMLDSTGVYNGDVGTIKGFITIDKLSVASEIADDKLTDEDNAFLKAIAKAQTEVEHDPYAQITQMVVAVEYTGVDSKGQSEKYIIFYRPILQRFEGFNKFIIPMDFDVVEHAWALSTHKLQGSQAHLIIMLCMSNNKRSPKPFVNRNMLYTMMTRAQKGLYLTGDIYGADSTYNIGVKYQANSTRTTMFDIM